MLSASPHPVQKAMAVEDPTTSSKKTRNTIEGDITHLSHMECMDAHGS